MAIECGKRLYACQKTDGQLNRAMRSITGTLKSTSLSRLAVYLQPYIGRKMLSGENGINILRHPTSGVTTIPKVCRQRDKNQGNPGTAGQYRH